MRKKNPRKLKEGEIIKVKVGGVEYDTIIDDGGVQRFKQNEFIDYAFKAGLIDLNQIALHVKKEYGTKIIDGVEYEDIKWSKENKFPQRDFLEFYMSLGYSVCGLAELSFFQDLEIENPLW